MADYDCWPLWDDEEPDNVDPATLPISAVLRARLEAWQQRFDAQLNRSVPQDSTWMTGDDLANFNREGEALADLLQQELGHGHVVLYRPQPAP